MQDGHVIKGARSAHLRREFGYDERYQTWKTQRDQYNAGTVKFLWAATDVRIEPTGGFLDCISRP
jgi:hypothetical protein